MSHRFTFAKLPQSTASIYKSLGFYERYLLPQNADLSDVHHVKVSMT